MHSLSGRSVAVIGGGFGGLSAACYLADAGADVTLLEKNDQLGGRASRMERDGFRFDMGPSWYLMPDVFERFFGHFGRAPSDYYGLERLDPHYRIFFKDGGGGSPDVRANGASGHVSPGGATSGPGATSAAGGADDPSTAAAAEADSPLRRPTPGGERVDLVPDRERNKELFESYENGAGAALERYLEQSRENYEVGMEYFVYEDRSRFRDWIDLDVARHARGLSLLGSMQDHVERYFEHPRLRQIVQYTLVFLGGSPTTTPALYNLMSHVDFDLGVWYPEGGMAGVVDAVVALGEELGVEYRTGEAATEIKGRAGGFLVETERGTYQADLVVSGADMAHTERELLPPEKRQYGADYWESRTYAPSAFLLYLGVEGELPELAHHTLVLPDDWQRHFDQIFEDPVWPDDPAYYLCAPSKTDETVAPDGHSSLFALVPVAPGLDDDERTRRRYRDLVLADVAANTGADLRDRIVVEERFSVSDFADRYNSPDGTALGMAHTLTQTALFRPNHRSSAVDGLYFAGSYTNPGIGVPMCLLSGEHAAEKVIADYGE